MSGAQEKTAICPDSGNKSVSLPVSRPIVDLEKITLQARLPVMRPSSFFIRLMVWSGYFAGTCLLCFFAVPHLWAQSSWELLWSDEFDYTGLPNPELWSYDVGGHGWGNAENQFYTESREENARVNGDHLIIEARKESWRGSNYTSARLVSKEKRDWTYGRIEVRAQLPSGTGTWPAIWMLPTNSSYGNGGWPDTGEIDIMEHVGHNPGHIHATIHTDAYNHAIGTQRGGKTVIADVSEAFHTYALEWTPEKLVFSIDENEFWTYSRVRNNWQGWPFDKDFHVVINIAIGGTWGGQQGIDDSIFPQKMLVDYVRVYRYTSLPQITIEVPPTVSTGGTAMFTGTAVAPNGRRIRRVELYQMDGLIETVKDQTAQWNVSIENVQQGCYEVYAKVIDHEGWSTDSESRPVMVGNSCPQNAPYLLRPHSIHERIEAEYFDLGGSEVAYRDRSSTNDGGGIRLSEGVDVYPTTDGIGYHIGNTSRREWISYTVHVDQSGIYDLQVRLASRAKLVSFSIEFDGIDKTGEFEHTNPTGKFQTIRVITEDGIKLDEGTQVMKFHFHDGIPSVNWFQFRLRSPTGNKNSPDRGKTNLMGNYPNPFTDSTIIEYQVGRPGPIILELFNTLGQHVRTLANGHHQTGTYSTVLYGRGLGSGVYFYQLTGDITIQRILQYLGP